MQRTVGWAVILRALVRRSILPLATEDGQLSAKQLGVGDCIVTLDQETQDRRSGRGQTHSGQLISLAQGHGQGIDNVQSSSDGKQRHRIPGVGEIEVE